jgi:hypothetical protein
MSSGEADIFVATNGNDDWSGTCPDPNEARTDGPFTTLQRARDAVRVLKQGGAEKDIVVLIRGGTYYLQETVVFGLEDSAPAGRSITYGAYPGEEPVLSSGVRIGGWQELDGDKPWDVRSRPAKAKIWVADVPPTLDRFYTLYDGDRRLPRARSAGFESTAPAGEWDCCWYGGSDAPLWSFPFPKGALRAWENLEDVEIVVRPSVGFTMNMLGLESVDVASGIARTSVEAAYAIRPLGGEDSIWVENVLEALDTPGEWVLNTREGKIYLWPTGDEPSDRIMAPCLRELIRVEGGLDREGPTDTPVRGLVFKDLNFTQGDRGVIAKDDASIQHDWEMIDKDDALVRLRGAEQCVVQHCKFFNSGGSAIRLDLHCQANRVVGNEINHLGGAGVLLIGYGPGTKDVNKCNEVVNNHIHHCGEIYWHAHGIVLWQSAENRVANNCIHHMPRKGICMGGVRPWFFDPARGLNVRECSRSIRWHEIENATEVQECGATFGWDRAKAVRWDPITPYLHTRDNLVEDNEVYRVGQLLSDGAAINITGAGEGNIIRRNYIHDLYNELFNSSIRIDDFQRGTLIEQNVIFRTNCGGLCFQHANTAVNNVVVNVRPSGYLYGSRPHDGATFARNIFFHTEGEESFWLYGDRKTRGDMSHPPRRLYENMAEFDYNLYFSSSLIQAADDPFAKMRKDGYEQNGAVADPLFVDWEAGDFRLQPDSPALKMGIQSIDLSEVGLTDDFPERFKKC